MRQQDGAWADRGRRRDRGARMDDGSVTLSRKTQLADNLEPTDVVIWSSGTHDERCTGELVDQAPSAKYGNAIYYLPVPHRVVVEVAKYPPLDSAGMLRSNCLRRLTTKSTGPDEHKVPPTVHLITPGACMMRRKPGYRRPISRRSWVNLYAIARLSRLGTRAKLKSG